jgi:hypothetical protein
MRRLANTFWQWYQRHYLATLVVTTLVFLLQLFHLYWLFTSVVLQRMFGHDFFVFPERFMFVYVLADYLEIPALVSATMLYVFEARRRPTFKSILYIVLLNTQWIHMFWITDQVVVDTFAGHSLFGAWNGLLAWVAILIDYLEVPVIVDTLRKVWRERDEIIARIRRNALGRRRAAAPKKAGTMPSRAA